VDERMNISFIEEVIPLPPDQCTRFVLTGKPEKLQKSRGAVRKIPAKLPEKPSELQ